MHRRPEIGYTATFERATGMSALTPEPDIRDRDVLLLTSLPTCSLPVMLCFCYPQSLGPMVVKQLLPGGKLVIGDGVTITGFLPSDQGPTNGAHNLCL